MLRALPVLVFLVTFAAIVNPANADVDTSVGLPYEQSWTNPGLITANDSWSGVPGVQGYRGDDLTTTTGTDARTVLSEGSLVTDVNANQTNANTYNTGGVAEFEIANPTVGFTGSGTGDAPNIVIRVDTTGRQNLALSFLARDLESTADDAIQQVAVQYRIGATGNYTRAGLGDADGYVADATTGGAATQQTAVNVTLPDATDNQPAVYVRIITTNALGNDENVGIDDIALASDSIGGNASPTITCGSTLTTPQGTATTREITARDADGTVTAIDVTGISPAPTAGAITVGPTTAQSGATDATATVTVSDAVPAGTYTVTLRGTNNDGTPQTATCDLTVTVQGGPVVTQIGAIQGSGAAANFQNTRRVVEGIVTGYDNEAGATTEEFPQDFRGLFIQDLGDGNAATSDGIFVASFPTTIDPTSIPLGTRVRVDGTVNENFGMTTLEIRANGSITQLGAGTIPAPVLIDETAADSQALCSGSTSCRVYYESLESMRVELDVGAANAGGTNKFDELFLEPGTTKDPILRTDAVKPAGLIGVDDDGGEDNPADPNNDTTPSSTVVNGDKFSLVRDLIGPVNFSFSTYRIMPQPGTAPTVEFDPAVPYPNILAPAASNRLRVAAFNVLDFFSAGGRPFPADPGGGPVITQGQFEEKRDRIVDAVGRLLGRPDVIGLEEVENLATAQSLATALGGYTAYLEEGNDNRGIDSALLIKNGVNVLSVTQMGKNAPGPVSRFTSQQVDCSDAAGSPGLFDRPPLAAEVEKNGLAFTVFVNHWASKRGGTSTTEDEACREGQADFLNDRVEQVEAAGGATDEAIVMGDLNAYEDEPEVTTNLRQGTSLQDLVLTIPAEERYSFQFDRQLQVLDHMVVTDGLAARLGVARFHHISVDYYQRPADDDGHALTDHDPIVADFVNNLPTAANDAATVSEDAGATAVPVLSNDTDADGDAIRISSASDPARGTTAVTAGGTGLTYRPDPGLCGSDSFTYVITGGAVATVTVTVTCVDDSPSAVADVATVVEDSGATPIDVLANDSDPDGGPRTIGSVTAPQHGVATITGQGGGLTYRPAADYCGPDSFSYSLNGGASATVSLTVTCVDEEGPPLKSPPDNTVPADTTAPETTITEKPKAKARVSAKRGKVKVAFHFAASEAGSKFECKLDELEFTPCDSPKGYRIGRGAHRFQVVAIDSAGNRDSTPATADLKVVRARRHR